MTKRSRNLPPNGPRKDRRLIQSSNDSSSDDRNNEQEDSHNSPWTSNNPRSSMRSMEPPLAGEGSSSGTRAQAAPPASSAFSTGDLRDPWWTISGGRPTIWSDYDMIEQPEGHRSGSATGAPTSTPGDHSTRDSHDLPGTSDHPRWAMSPIEPSGRQWSSAQTNAQTAPSASSTDSTRDSHDLLSTSDNSRRSMSTMRESSNGHSAIFGTRAQTTLPGSSSYSNDVQDNLSSLDLQPGDTNYQSSSSDTRRPATNEYFYRPTRGHPSASVPSPGDSSNQSSSSDAHRNITGENSTENSTSLVPSTPNRINPACIFMPEGVQREGFYQEFRERMETKKYSGEHLHANCTPGCLLWGWPDRDRKKKRKSVDLTTFFDPTVPTVLSDSSDDSHGSTYRREKAAKAKRAKRNESEEQTDPAVYSDSSLDSDSDDGKQTKAKKSHKVCRLDEDNDNDPDSPSKSQ